MVVACIILSALAIGLAIDFWIFKPHIPVDLSDETRIENKKILAIWSGLVAVTAWAIYFVA